MAQFSNIFSRFVSPYKGYAVLNVVLNLLSTVLSLFSFAAIIPVLQILFGIADANLTYTDIATTTSIGEYAVAVKDNLFWWLQEQIAVRGSGWVLFVLGLFLVAMTGLKCLCAFLALYCMVPIRTGVLRDLRKALYDKVVSLPIGFFTEEHKGDIMSRMTADVTEVEASIMASLDMVFKDPIMIVVYLITLFCLSWQLTLFVLILLPTAGLLIGRIGRSLKRRSTRGQEQTGEILTQIEETLGGLRVVKAFNAEAKLSDRFDALNNATRHTFNRIYRRYYLAHPISEFLGTALIAVLLWYGGGLILAEHSSIDAAEFIYYLVIFYSIIGPAKDLSKATYSIRKGMASLDRIDRILNTESNIQEPNNPVPLPITRSLQHPTTFVGEPEQNAVPFIEFRNVSFAYREGQPVLRHINLKIQRGQTVALVGQSGSGKTTLVDLVPRFYDVTEGAILINGIDIRSVRTHDLRELMGNVNQEAILFNDTFYNNITFGWPKDWAGNIPSDRSALGQPSSSGSDNSSTSSALEHSSEIGQKEAVVSAAKAANAYDFIMATPDGWLTMVGDRGSRLSGGQRQRISIARAILKNPEILILDEATSALDTESEKLVQEALDHLMKGRTTLVVAHRLSTIRNADLICVLHEGEIVERGRHDELMTKGGYYAKLIEMQQA